MKTILKYPYISSIIIYCISGFYIFAQSSLHVDGTYDLNGNGRSELLISGGEDWPLKYVELDEQGQHEILWKYSTNAALKITDAKLLDLNGDGLPELLAAVTTLADNGKEKQPWLFVFSWQEDSFSSKPFSLYNSSGAVDRYRPFNLAVEKKSRTAAVSLASPSRKGMLIDIALIENNLNLSAFQVVQPKIINNGYGHVYVGLFSREGTTLLALICPEGNGLKAAVYSVGESLEEISSDLLIMNGARRLLGSAIMAHDENKDGNEELLLPFETGEVLALSLEGKNIILKPSRFSTAGLFLIPPSADAGFINDILLKRIEAGLYETPLGNTDDLSLDVDIDTLLLGDTLIHFVLKDSVEEFYGFHWLSAPPPGLVFDPLNAALNWVPARKNIGPVKVRFGIEIRIEEKLVSSRDELGDRHQITSVLASRTDSASFMVLDTTFIQKQLQPLVYILPRNYSIGLYSGNISATDRYVFEGEPPYGMSSAILTDSLLGGVTTTISANLNSISQDKISKFSFKSSLPEPENVVTLSLIHDLEENLFFASINPARDSIPQSFHPRGMDPDLSLYPEYFFEGFTGGIRMDSAGGQIKFKLAKVRAHEEGLITLTSPLNEDHKFQIYYSGGLPHTVRGEVRIKDNGNYKIVTEIDFEAEFIPIRMLAAFASGKKDTILFFPDSLLEKQELPYAPARVLLPAPEEPELIDLKPTAEIPIDPQPADSLPAAVFSKIADSTGVDSVIIPQQTLPEIPDTSAENAFISGPEPAAVSRMDTLEDLISADTVRIEAVPEEKADSAAGILPDTISLDLNETRLDSLVPEISEPVIGPDSL
ncbi:MAG: VCBS repeat-containing protein [Candidatus Neomarinimicrobiota bacterium]